MGWNRLHPTACQAERRIDDAGRMRPFGLGANPLRANPYPLRMVQTNDAVSAVAG